MASNVTAVMQQASLEMFSFISMMLGLKAQLSKDRRTDLHTGRLAGRQFIGNGEADAQDRCLRRAGGDRPDHRRAVRAITRLALKSLNRTGLAQRGDRCCVIAKLAEHEIGMLAERRRTAENFARG